MPESIKTRTMRFLKTLSLTLVLSTAVLNSMAINGAYALAINYLETPAKTICIKNPAASNPTTFFSTTTVLMFEVYKPGSKEEMDKIVSSLKKDSNVQSCDEGATTGDYHAITLVLKSAKDKAWFVSLFKKAGLNTVKINNNPIIDTEKL